MNFIKTLKEAAIRKATTAKARFEAMIAKLLATCMAVLMMVMGPAAYAQTVQTPLQLLEAQKSAFIGDTTALLAAGTGMLIVILLIYGLFRLVLNFFRKGA